MYGAEALRKQCMYAWLLVPRIPLSLQAIMISSDDETELLAAAFCLSVQSWSTYVLFLQSISTFQVHLASIIHGIGMHYGMQHG